MKKKMFVLKTSKSNLDITSEWPLRWKAASFSLEAVSKIWGTESRGNWSSS